ncbi:unnamed protein product [Cyclocybe aegerita]|uniref:Uncharacterized protein n=1 Tax=Cyclocybe aegerita TaxID=1973307 RepID=A0A8S0W4I9_CYCAE|nr:unnamed protein product [Cyclocybe aegerita]
MERLYIPIHFIVFFFKPVNLGCKAYDTIVLCVRFIRPLLIPLEYLAAKFSGEASRQKALGHPNPNPLHLVIDVKEDVNGTTYDRAVRKYLAGGPPSCLSGQPHGAQANTDQGNAKPETATEPETESQPELTQIGQSTKCVPVSGGEVIAMYHNAHAFLGLPEPYMHSSTGGNPAAARSCSVLPNVTAAHSQLGLHTTLFSSPVATRSSISVNRHRKSLITGGGNPSTQIIYASSSTPNLHIQPGVAQREMHTLVTHPQHHQMGRLSVPTRETRRSTEQGYSVSDSDENGPAAIIHDENDDDDNRSYSQTAVISIHSPSTSTLRTTLGTDDDGPFLADPRITPVMPESTQRYSKRGVISREHTNISIAPLTLAFREPVAPSGWVKMVHPEGGRYYYHPEKCVYTDADLLDGRILVQLIEDLETIQQFILNHNLSLPEGCHLVVDLSYELDEIKTTYFFVDHHTRSIFFLDIFEAQNLSGWYEAPGSTSQSHLRLEIEAQYWFFVQLYPDSLSLSLALICELRDIVMHYVGDVMTSPSSTTPFSADKLDKILSHTNMMEGNVGPGLAAVGNMSCLARYFYLFSHTKFIHFAGEPNARLDRNTSAYGEHTQSRTWFIKIASSLLFYGPDYYLQTIQSIWVDRICHKNEWDVVISKVNEEWKEVVLFSVILLNANGVFISTQDVHVSTTARDVGYISVAASIGSLAAALLLTTKTRRNNLRAAEDVQSFLSANNNTRFGLEALSTICALPHALLTWGSVFLALASSICVRLTSHPESSLPES